MSQVKKQIIFIKWLVNIHIHYVTTVTPEASNLFL